MARRIGSGSIADLPKTESNTIDRHVDLLVDLDRSADFSAWVDVLLVVVRPSVADDLEKCGLAKQIHLDLLHTGIPCVHPQLPPLDHGKRRLTLHMVNIRALGSCDTTRTGVIPCCRSSVLS